MRSTSDESAETPDARPARERIADPSAPVRTRPWSPAVLGLVISALCAVGFTALAAQVSRPGRLVGLDHGVLDAVAMRRSEPLVDMWSVLTWVGDGALVVPLAVLVGSILGFAARSWSPFLLLVLTTAGIGLAVELLKQIIARPRPPVLEHVSVEDGFGFPSGHTAHAAAVYLMIAVLAGTILRSVWVRTGIAIAAVALTATAMISRVLLGVHSPSDVWAGLLLGVGWTVLLLSLWKLVESGRRARREQPGPAG